MTPWNRHRLLVIKNHRPKPKSNHVHSWYWQHYNNSYECHGCEKVITAQQIFANGTTDEEVRDLFNPR